MLRYERRERQVIERPARAPGGVVGPAEVGRALRNERIRQGLSHSDAARRLGIPEEQLRAAESGTLGRTDQLSALKTVRRFADLLGLPGDRYALAILEHWPTASPGAVRSSVARRDDPTATTPAVRTHAPTGGHPCADDLFGSPFTPFDAGFTGFDAGLAVFDAPFDTGDDTGVVPAVPIATTSGLVRRNPMPWPMRAAAVALAFAVAAGGALLVVDRVHPSWLRGIGLARVSVPEAAGAATQLGHTAPTAEATDARGSSAAGTMVIEALRPHSTSRNAATLNAGPAPVQMTVAAVGGPCWVQVTSPTSPSPLFAGVLAPGSSRSFSVTHSASVELGSAAARVSAKSRSGQLATYQPPVAPFTLSVRSSR